MVRRDAAPQLGGRDARHEHQSLHRPRREQRAHPPATRLVGGAEDGQLPVAVHEPQGTPKQLEAASRADRLREPEQAQRCRGRRRCLGRVGGADAIVDDRGCGHDVASGDRGGQRARRGGGGSRRRKDGALQALEFATRPGVTRRRAQRGVPVLDVHAHAHAVAQQSFADRERRLEMQQHEVAPRVARGRLEASHRIAERVAAGPEPEREAGAREAALDARPQPGRTRPRRGAAQVGSRDEAPVPAGREGKVPLRLLCVEPDARDDDVVARRRERVGLAYHARTRAQVAARDDCDPRHGQRSRRARMVVARMVVARMSVALMSTSAPAGGPAPRHPRRATSGSARARAARRPRARTPPPSRTRSQRPPRRAPPA